MDAEHDEALLRSADADADADTDGGSPSIEAEEQAHLDEVLGAVRAAVDRARGLAERTEASHREAGRSWRPRVANWRRRRRIFLPMS